MHAESKLPEPKRVDGIVGPPWTPATIERWAEREWWGEAVTVGTTTLTLCYYVTCAEDATEP